jgi:hypothetical protein
VNTLKNAVAQLAGPDTDTVWAKAAPALAKLPQDRHVSERNKGKDGFRRADQLLTQVHADVSFELAQVLANALVETSERRKRISGACVEDVDTVNDATCVSEAIASVGPSLLRRQLSAEDTAFYQQALRNKPADAEALSDVVTLLLSAPEFAYQFESETKGEPLPAVELASKLASQLTDSPADHRSGDCPVTRFL